MEKAELTALIVKAQAGDQAAMEEVLRTAHTSVSYQCRKLLRDPRDAEDMTQEVLLTVYTRLDTLKTPEAFWGWLNQTTANRCVNAMKRSRVELQFAEDEEGHSVLDDLEELDEQQVPDKALDNTETTRMIEEIVDGLPDAQRVCTLMYYYDEMYNDYTPRELTVNMPTVDEIQLLKRYEDERTEKLEQRTKLSTQLEACQEDEKASDDWLALIRDYSKLEELDRPTLLRLVKRIEVGERKTVNGHDERDIKIYYNFVGFVEL